MHKFYQPRQTSAGNWGFKTPTGKVDYFTSQAMAERVAAITERDDREEAKTGTGPIAAVLRKHFEATASAVRDKGGRNPLIELQRRFSAAAQVLDKAWVIYRADRSDADALCDYTRALLRCQKLRDAIFQLMSAMRERRAA